MAIPVHPATTDEIFDISAGPTTSPDSNPPRSLSVYMFFAPALMWLGAALLLVRLHGRALTWVAGRAGGRAGGPGDSGRAFLLASAARRGPAINRGLIVVALLLAFGVELGLFTATYDPSPDALAVPWAYLAELALAALVTTRDRDQRTEAPPAPAWPVLREH